MSYRHDVLKACLAAAKVADPDVFETYPYDPRFDDEGKHGAIGCAACEESVDLTGRRYADTREVGAFLKDHGECEPEPFEEDDFESPGAERSFYDRGGVYAHDGTHLGRLDAQLLG